MDNWWYCLHHGQIEHGPGCAHADRLGPYKEEWEARHALDRVHERNRAWDRQEAIWEGEAEE